MSASALQDFKRKLESQGVALAGTWGGPQKQRYYTPSGEEVWAIPSMREWAQKDSNGKIVRNGLRDANLDKGWTLSPPTELKLHCSGCDKWHDTEGEVQTCVARKGEQAKVWERKAQQMFKKDGGGADEVATLTAKVEELTALVEKLLEVQNR